MSTNLRDREPVPRSRLRDPAAAAHSESCDHHGTLPRARAAAATVDHAVPAAGRAVPARSESRLGAATPPPGSADRTAVTDPALGDAEAFTAAYRRLAPTARAAALAVLRDGEAADDVVQDVFCALWTHPDAYRPERGSLAAFVQVMARSRALDRLRSRTAAAAALDRLEARLRPATAEPPWEEVIRRDSARAMLQVLDGLPDGQRAALLLHHVGGLSDGELARALRVPLGTAKSRIRLGTRRARAAAEERLAA